MNRDPLSDVLRAVHLRGAVFFYVTCRDDWAAIAPPSRDLAGSVVPGAEHVIAYHLIASGNGWAAVDGEPPVRVGAGDIVMFPQGDGHVLSSAPGTPQSRGDDDWSRAAGAHRQPLTIAYRNGECLLGAEVPAEESNAVVVCGFVGCDLRPFNPLVGALPRLLHLPATALAEWVAPMLRQAVAESRNQRHGSIAVLERVSEMVFVDCARRYLESLPESGGSGWLAALRDRYVGKALGLLHGRAAESWTVEELGRQVGLSRSALHERFVDLVGQPPMQYLAQWRMQLGARALRGSDATVASVALDIGYESEAAFSRAFKRLVGQPPAAWRRRQRA